MRLEKLAVAAAARQVQSLLEGGLPTEGGAPVGAGDGSSSRAMSKGLFMLLAVGLWIALANAALAGPTTTTTTFFGQTTTTTSSTTTTTGPTTTTTTTTTSTTTTLPGDLSGQYPFVDKKTGEKNQSFMDVDTSLSQICVAGAVQEVDPTTTLNRSVTFSYSSNGTITKATDKKVSADFGSVVLTLDIREVDATSAEFNETITVDCKLKASLKQPKGPQSTEPAQDHVKLDCDLGEDFSAFTGLTDQFIENIQNAYAKRKTVKADPKKGRLKIKTSGSEILPGDDLTPASTCTVPG